MLYNFRLTARTRLLPAQKVESSIVFFSSFQIASGPMGFLTYAMTDASQQSWIGGILHDMYLCQTPLWGPNICLGS